jgi:hypothetical protein
MNSLVSSRNHPYAIECQKCGHAWLTDRAALHAGERGGLRCPVCEPSDSCAPTLISAPATPRLSPELSGKTWVITRARRARRSLS